MFLSFCISFRSHVYCEVGYRTWVWHVTVVPDERLWFFCGYNQCCRSGVMTSIFLFDNVVCCVSLCIDAKAREAYSTGQNVYVPSPQVWLSFDRWCPLLGLSTSCSATFWQLFVFRATFFAFWTISSSFLPILNICFSRQLENFLWKKSVILSPPPTRPDHRRKMHTARLLSQQGFFGRKFQMADKYSLCCMY